MPKRLKNWWRVVLGVIIAGVLALAVLFYVKAKPAVDFVRENFATESTSDKNVTTEPFILYISAIDERDGSLPEKSRSDLNILAVVNPTKKQVLLVNIPRDYYVNLPGINQYDKLTHAGSVGGVELSKATIEELLDIKIDYTLRLNFNALSGVVDAIGGITVNSDTPNTYSCYWDNTCVITPGANQLDGKCAVAFSRERLSFSDGDLTRGENQEKVISAIFEKISHNKSLLFNYEKILKAVDGSFETTISADEILKFAQLISADWQISEQNLAVSGSGLVSTYSYPEKQLFVFYPNPDSISEVRAAILNMEN